MVELKGDATNIHSDLVFWKWALGVIKRLGSEGMSSEESDHDALSDQKIYRIKIVAWRKRIDSLLADIDSVRGADNHIFSSRGSLGVKKVRPPPEEYFDTTTACPRSDSAWPVTSRDPMAQLPYVFYDDRWFRQVDSEIRQATLQVSAEEFQWFQLYRMHM